MFEGLQFRTTDPDQWGTGKGSDLTATEVDQNFYECITRIKDLEDNPPEPVNITNISVVGSQMLITMSDASTYGPFTLPVATFQFRDEYTSPNHYYELDFITVAGRGLYMVRIEHDVPAATPFDPAADDGDGHLLYQLVFGEDLYFYDFGMFYPGKPGFGVAPSATMMAHLLGREMYLQTSLPGSLAKLEVDPAADLSFTLKKNATTIGTLDFTAGSASGVFTFSANVQFEPGDIFKVLSPASLDDDADCLTVTILGIRGTIPS